MILTARKAWHLVRDEGRQKRGGTGSAPVDTPSGQDDDSSLGEILSREPTPEFAAELAEEYQLLLGRLADRELETIAAWKMEGYTNAEGCCPL